MINVGNGPIINAYPDSIGTNLSDIVWFLNMDEVKGAFQTFYILPSIFNTDLDRGFSVIDYGINEVLASERDIREIKKSGISLKLDFVLNHISVLSKQFQDILKNGENSEYKDFFINWNDFFCGCGKLGSEGYIVPEKKYLEGMFFRKPGLPILMVRFPNGEDAPYWNTFYQETIYPDLTPLQVMEILDVQYLKAVQISDWIKAQNKRGLSPEQYDANGFEEYKQPICEYLQANRRYLGQMDLNIQSDKVWEYYDSVLKQLSDYGAKIVRLDAFAYTSKKPGRTNFLNEPETWDILARIQKIADNYHLCLLPEIHASYADGIYEVLAKKGYMTYDFFLPGLILDAFEQHNGSLIQKWAMEITEKGIVTVNMLGCHDGIPLLDLKGIIPEDRIEKLISTIVDRGGFVKDLHGAKNIYYQVNATYFSALGEDEKKLLLARAIQIFMPGIPQVWYLDLFAGKNDYEAVRKAGVGGHKEINRTNLSMETVLNLTGSTIVQKQLELLRLRNSFPAFSNGAAFCAAASGSKLTMNWTYEGFTATLNADLSNYTYQIVTGQSE